MNLPQVSTVTMKPPPPVPLATTLNLKVQI